MSSQSSFVSVPSANVGDAQAPNWILQQVGSVFRAVPVAVADTETQGFLIDAYGRLISMGTAPDNAAPIGNPNLMAGVYETAFPTYDDGDVANLHLDVNGLLLSRVTGDADDNSAASGRPVRVGGMFLAALPTYDAGDATTFQMDVNGQVFTRNSLLEAVDYATETTLAAILADTTALLAVDFATETTLAAVLADTTALLALDYATETTLAAVLADTTAILALDFATETTLAAVLADTTALLALDFATETTLALVLADTTSIIANTNPLTVESALYVDYSLSNLPGNATNPLQLIAVTVADIRKAAVFDTGGIPCEIMLGAAAAEVRKAVFGPGCDTTIDIDIPAGSRVSIRRLDSASALTGGNLSINFLN